MTAMEDRTAAPGIDGGKLAELATDSRDVRSREAVFEVDALSVTYNGALALDGVTLDIHKNAVTAFIGPSGCGKSTFIRCLNRMNDVIPGAKVGGRILYHGRDLYGSNVDPEDCFAGADVPGVGRQLCELSTVDSGRRGPVFHRGHYRCGKSDVTRPVSLRLVSLRCAVL